MKKIIIFSLVVFFLYLPVVYSQSLITYVNETFETSEGGFVYQDNIYQGTNNSAQESGKRESNSSCATGSCLAVNLNIENPNNISGGYSGGWNRTFTVTSNPSSVNISFDYTLRLANTTDLGEIASIYYRNVSTGSAIQGATLEHNNPASDAYTSGRVSYIVNISNGDYSFDAGCHLTQVSANDENAECWIDNVLIQGIVSSVNPSCSSTSPCCCYTTQGGAQRRCYSTGVCCAIGTPDEYWSSGSCYSATIIATGPGIYAIGQKTPITILITNNGAYADTYNLSYTIESSNPNLIILDITGATTLTVGAGQTGNVVPTVTVLSTGVSGKIIVNVTSVSDPTQWRTANVTIIEGYLPFSLPEFSSVWIILIIVLSGFAFYLKTVRKI